MHSGCLSVLFICICYVISYIYGVSCDMQSADLFFVECIWQTATAICSSGSMGSLACIASDGFLTKVVF